MLAYKYWRCLWPVCFLFSLCEGFDPRGSTVQGAGYRCCAFDINGAVVSVARQRSTEHSTEPQAAPPSTAPSSKQHHRAQHGAPSSTRTHDLRDIYMSFSSPIKFSCNVKEANTYIHLFFADKYLLFADNYSKYSFL